MRAAGSIALGLLLFCTATTLQAAEIEQADVQLEAVREAIAAIETWMDQAAASQSSLERDLREANRGLAELQRNIDENRGKLASVETDLADLRERAEQLEHQKRLQQDIVASAVRSSWMLGSDSPARLLLNLEDPGPGARMMRYYAAFNADRVQRINAFAQTLADLNATALAIDANALILQQHTGELQHQMVELEAKRQTRANILKDLEAELAARSGELKELEDNRQHLEELIDEINRIVEVIPAPAPRDAPATPPAPFADARRQLPWPLEGPLLNRFGARYSEGNLQRQGVIIAASEGSPVTAVHAGRVVFSDWLRGSGLLVVVDHGAGYLTLYGQNQTLPRRTGEWVERGDIIGAAGANAGLDSPGIYFEIRHNGQPQDPVTWCIAR